MATPFAQSLRTIEADGFERTLYGLAAAMGLLVAWLAWLLWARVDVVVTARGLLRPEVPDLPVMSSVAARVRRVAVHEGDAVTAGQVLFVLESRTTAGEVAEMRQKKDLFDLARRQMQQELPLQETSLQGQVDAEHRKAETLASSIVQVRNECEERRQEAEQQTREMQLEIGRQQELLVQVGLDLRQADGAVANAKAVLDANERLVHGGVVSKLALLDLENRYQQAVTTRQKLKVEEERTRQAVQQDQDAIGRVQSGLQAATSELLRQEQQLTMDQDAAVARAAELGKQLALVVRLAHDKVRTADIDYRKAVADTAPGVAEKGEQSSGRPALAREAGVIEVKAPSAGRISTLRFRQPGAVVAAGDTLAELLPAGVPLQVEAWVANRDAGQLRPGLPVRVKLDAYPYEQFGAVPGTVVWVSPDAETAPDLGPAYRIKCSLSTTTVQWDGHTASLRPGLAGTVEIVAGRKPVADLLLQTLREKGEGFSPARLPRPEDNRTAPN